ncbi:flagellar biosynthetic protein FliO [Agrobacterium rosae]|uniref:flagellar biosynthetic protein FliO n=1 Tax=Agrobacterium rosae TaxID=1972867 RepID=UPI002A11CBD8|nr:flagellar biosynthetic protein FliO [Agrobacterium rosae]MDX8313637.1 flagellar biosynthetic protein FliO [Agrobacterium rosae]
MMEEFIGTYGNNLIVAVVGVGVALLAMAIIMWLIRRRGGSSPFIRGGKNRQPRLQVLDATAVDARRRLVLVRRDNVEHLVMIGGPTDIVIESGIGAIPIMRDVRDPQDDLLQAPPSEKSIASNRPRALTSGREEDIRTTAPIATAAAAPAPVATAAPVAQPRPEPKPAPSVAPPRPIAAAPPKPTAPPIVAAPPAPPAPRPVQPASQPVLEVAPAPKPVAREPISPPLTAAVVPAVTAASLQQEPVAKPSAPEPVVVQQPAPPPVVTTPPPVAAPEPVIDQHNAVDFLDAARERVLPTFRTATPLTATANIAKPEPLAPGESGAVFGDQLTSDFESFLEAEIAKNNAVEAPDVSLEPRQQREFTEPVSPPAPGTSTDQDVQKEMARIFGEMAVTRDK